MSVQDGPVDPDPGRQKRRAREKLDTLLLDGLNSGDPLPADAKLWSSLRQEALARLEAHRKTASKK